MTESNTEPADVDALLAKAASGEESAFEQLFHRYQHELWRLIELRLDKRLRPRVDTADVIQETYLEALQRFPDYLERRPMPFGVWLKQTARQRIVRTHRDHATTAKRSIQREQPLPDNSSAMIAKSFAGEKSTPSEIVSRNEYHQLVQAAIEQLSPVDQELLLMRNVEDLPYREIALLLEIEEAAARKRYGRVLLRLRSLLPSPDGDSQDG